MPNRDARSASFLSTGAGVAVVSDACGAVGLVEPFPSLHEAQVSDEMSFLAEQFSQVHCSDFLPKPAPKPAKALVVGSAGVVELVPKVKVDGIDVPKPLNPENPDELEVLDLVESIPNLNAKGLLFVSG